MGQGDFFLVVDFFWSRRLFCWATFFGRDLLVEATFFGGKWGVGVGFRKQPYFTCADFLLCLALVTFRLSDFPSSVTFRPNLHIVVLKHFSKHLHIVVNVTKI